MSTPSQLQDLKANPIITHEENPQDLDCTIQTLRIPSTCLPILIVIDMIKNYNQKYKSIKCNEVSTLFFIISYYSFYI
jgi:hypothetical protein